MHEALAANPIEFLSAVQRGFGHISKSAAKVIHGESFPGLISKDIIKEFFNFASVKSY
jgi:hypothetical protein